MLQFVFKLCGAKRCSELIMNKFLILLAGVMAGTYFAERIQSKVPALDPDHNSQPQPIGGNVVVAPRG